jgi:hypothetical protein
VITIDCVDGETNFGVRDVREDVALGAGTVMVNFVDVATAAGPVGALGAPEVLGVGAAAGRLCVPPPPEQLQRPQTTKSASARVRIETPQITEALSCR